MKTVRPPVDLARGRRGLARRVARRVARAPLFVSSPGLKVGQGTQAISLRYD